MRSRHTTHADKAIIHAGNCARSCDCLQLRWRAAAHCDRLQKLKQVILHVVRIVAQPDVREKLLAQDYQPAPITPVEHDKILREQIQMFGEVEKRFKF